LGTRRIYRRRLPSLELETEAGSSAEGGTYGEAGLRGSVFCPALPWGSEQGTLLQLTLLGRAWQGEGSAAREEEDIKSTNAHLDHKWF